MKTLAFSLVPLAFRAAAVNWVADHWLIALTAVLIVAGSMALWVRWIMGKVAPVGYEDETGFHLFAKLMPREEVERQLTAALEQRWEDDPEARKRLGEFKAALEEWHDCDLHAWDPESYPADSPYVYRPNNPGRRL